MADLRTIRCLSIDPGGTKGYMPLKFLRRFVQQWGIAEDELWKYHDVIAGSSSGGILALAIAFGLPLSLIEGFFLEKAKRIFTTRAVPIGCDTALDSNRPTFIQKIGLILINDPFYKSPCAPDAGNSNFGTNILQEILVEYFGDATLQDLKTKVIIPSLQIDQNRFVLFSNYDSPDFYGQNAKLVDVARATSGVPVLFPDYEFGTNRYLDGGLFVGNPSRLALSMGKALKPLANRACVLSLGTGRGKFGFDGTPSDDVSTAINYLFSLFEMGYAGSQETAARDLQIEGRRTLSQLYFYRFQPDVDPMVFNDEGDNSTPEFFVDLNDLTQAKYDEDIVDIDDYLARLIA